MSEINIHEIAEHFDRHHDVETVFDKYAAYLDPMPYAEYQKLVADVVALIEAGK